MTVQIPRDGRLEAGPQESKPPLLSGSRTFKNFNTD